MVSDLLTTTEAAARYTELTGRTMSSQRLGQLIRAGKLAATRMGNYNLIARTDLEAFITHRSSTYVDGAPSDNHHNKEE